MRAYLDWPAVPGEERCCERFDKGRSLEKGLAGRADLDTQPWRWKDNDILECEPKRR